MSNRLVTYNGVRVTADWPARVEAAQSLTHYTVAGKKFPRIRFGDEDPRWGQKPCLDCAVLKGQLHVPDCEYEKCPVCGAQRAGDCSCDAEELREPGEESKTVPPQSWVGRWVLIGLGCVLIVLLLLTLWTVLIVGK